MIPLVALDRQLEELAPEIEQGWKAVLERSAFILGPEVGDFEEEFAAFSEVRHCIGVANGTDALELALRALDVGPGDEVIVPANTFVASALAVARTGATPVLVDCVGDTQLIDADQALERVGPRTKAIMPVHLFGQIAPVERLSPAELPIVEDAAQSQGARRNGSVSGGLGVIAGTSFYPGKNLGAYGDAGAVTTSDEELARRVRALRNYGSEIKYHHPVTGFNSRLDTLQAVVLRAKLRRLEHWNEQRRRAAQRYDELLADVDGVRLPETLAGNEHVWHLYVVRVRDRDEIVRRLNESGVGAGIHYPVPVHLQGAFAHLGHAQGDFPQTESAAREILSLPIFPGITESEQDEVATRLRAAIR